jgi:hypothetical protein
MLKTLDDYNIHDRHQLRLQVRLKLTKPLSHMSGSDGNRSNLMKMDLLGLDGTMRPCPMFSANAFRGWVLRRVGQMAMLNGLGITVSADTHSLLFAGGSTQKGATMGNDLGMYDRIAQLYPPLSLLGGAKPAKVFGSNHSQMLQGRLDIGNFYLVCAESAGAVPSWALPSDVAMAKRQIRDSADALIKARKPDGFRDIVEYGTPDQITQYITLEKAHRALVAQLMPGIRSALRSQSSWTAESQSIRSDAGKDPKLKAFLAPAESTGLLEGIAEEKPKKGAKKAKDGDDAPTEKSTQMIMSDELLAIGSELVSTITTRTPGITAVEEGYLVYALQEWGKHPAMGGKAARGCGGFPSIEIWYECGDEKGEYLQLDNGVEKLSDRAAEARQRWQEYLEVFEQYLGAASTDERVKGLLCN